MKKAIYKIRYYEKDPNFGWTNTIYDNVLATSKDKALEKFEKKHPDINVKTIVNQIWIDY